MGNYRLFISWSKQQAERVAPHLRDFLQDVLGLDEIFLSQLIDSGRRWGEEIAKALEECDAGLIIVTPENLNAPWLNFEAGAISKKVEESNVIPLLLNVRIGDLSGSPLNQFQSRSFDEDGLLQVVYTLGEIYGVSKEVIDRRFPDTWNRLGGAIENITLDDRSMPEGVELADVFALLQRLESQVVGIENQLRNADRVIEVDKRLAATSRFKSASLLDEIQRISEKANDTLSTTNRNAPPYEIDRQTWTKVAEILARSQNKDKDDPSA